MPYIKPTLIIAPALFIYLILPGCALFNPAEQDLEYSSPVAEIQIPTPEQDDLASVDIDSEIKEMEIPEEPLSGSESTEKIPEELTVPDSETTLAEEVKELEALGPWVEGTPEEVTEEAEVTFDFPVTMNKQVEFYLDFFQNKHRESFTRWLCRSTKYIPLVQEQLREAGLPEDLAYLPMIESGYNLTAYSRARAVGPWQFMRATGRNYGLTINSYVDERRDPIKSTKAAVAYLSALFEEFNSWHLAVAGYNAGEGRIRKGIRKYKTNNFWELAQTKHLRLETKRYVPKLIAAILIAKEPHKYGFTDLAYEEPFTYETVDVPRWTTLRAVAVAIDMDFEELRNYNRQLRRAISPPDPATYTLRVPFGTAKLVEQNLPRVHAVMTTDYKTHTVRHGETLTGICKKYNLNKTTLLKANDLRSASLVSGKRLRIPFRTTSYKLLSENEVASKIGPASAIPENLVLHKVRPGETISEISKRYGAPPHMIAAWNDLESIHRIRAGQQLALFLSDTDTLPPQPSYTEAEEEEPQKNFQVASNPAKTRPEYDEDSGESETRLTYYMVQGGDTLWTIAKRYNLTPEKIRRWNQIKGDLIFPGKRLLLKVKKDADV